MGLVDRIMFQGWPRPLRSGEQPHLTLDLTHGMLGPFRVLSEARLLRQHLGPPVSWKRMREGQWLYPALSLAFDVSGEVIEGYTLVVRQPESSVFAAWAKRWQPFAGAVSFPDMFKAYPEALRIETFLRHAGEPTRREDGDEDTFLYYHDPPAYGKVSFDVEFTAQGDLVSLEIY